MLFFIVTKALHVMLDSVNHNTLFFGFSIENSAMKVSHLRLAEEQLFVCDAKIEKIDHLNLF